MNHAFAQRDFSSATNFPGAFWISRWRLAGARTFLFDILVRSNSRMNWAFSKFGCPSRPTCCGQECPRAALLVALPHCE
jgi:hypothetical protein